MEKALRMLYRRLLRRAAVVDSHPAVQLLFRKECHGFNDALDQSDSLYQRWLEHLFGPGRCFMPADPRQDPNFHPIAGLGTSFRSVNALKYLEKPVTTSLRKTFRDGFELHRIGQTCDRDQAIHAGLRIQRVLVKVLIAADEMGLLKHQLSAWQATLCKGCRHNSEDVQAEQPTTSRRQRRRTSRATAKKDGSGSVRSGFPFLVPDPPTFPILPAPQSPRLTRCKWWIEALREMLGPPDTLSPCENAMLRGFKPALTPCPGVFLIEHPLAQSRYFSRNVVVLTQHTSQGSSCGLTVNAPMPPFSPGFPTASQRKWLERAAGGEDNFAFLKSSGGFAYGGNSTTFMNVMHSKHDLEDAGVQLPQSLPHTQVFLGNSLKSAIDALRKGTLKKSSFRPFWGATTWQKQKLQEELDKGMWIMVQAPSNLAIEAVGHEFLWEKLLLSMGPPYAELSLIPDDVRERVYAADGIE